MPSSSKVARWRRGKVEFNSFVQNGKIFVNNEPFFMMGFYHVSWGDGRTTNVELTADTQWMGANGWNTIFAQNVAGISALLTYYDAAAAAGVYVICEDVPDVDRPQLVGHPAHFGNPTMDDIPCDAITVGRTPADTLALHNQAKGIDPNHVTLMSTGATCAKTAPLNAAAYMTPDVCSDLLGNQSYPIGNPGVDPNPLIENFETLALGVEQAAPYGVPMIATLQCFPWAALLPTPAEMRSFLYGALMAGVPGIFYYAYFDGDVDINDEPDMKAELALQGAEVGVLKDVLIHGELTQLGTGFGDVIAAQWVYGGTAYIVVANMNETTSRAATVGVLSVASGTPTALFSGRPTGMTHTGGMLTGTLNARDVHVYSMPANGTPPSLVSDITCVATAISQLTGTTSFSVTLPTTQAGDLILLEFNHRGSANGTIGGTYTSSTLALKHSQTYGGSLSCKLMWSRATGNHAGQTMTASGLSGSCGAVVTVYRGALASGDPLTGATIVGEENPTGDEEQAEITTTEDDVMVVLTVGTTGGHSIRGHAAARMGMFTERVSIVTTAGPTVGVSHSSKPMAVAGPTGGFSWRVYNRAQASWAYAIRSA